MSNQAKRLSDCPAERLAQCRGDAAAAGDGTGLGIDGRKVDRVGPVGKYDLVLKPFLRLMENELHANSGKGDRPAWLAMPADTCMLEIYYHVGKLQKALKDGDGDRICEYAADVANLSMMLTDLCGALGLAARGVTAPAEEVRPQVTKPLDRCSCPVCWPDHPAHSFRNTRC